jgi:hypothetical protein
MPERSGTLADGPFRGGLRTVPHLRRRRATGIGGESGVGHGARWDPVLLCFSDEGPVLARTPSVRRS